MIMNKTKICSVCGKKFPPTTEYFFACKNAKDGLKARCKECSKKDNKKNHDSYYKKNKEKVNAKNMENYYKLHPKEIIQDGYKRCSVCGEEKPLTTEFFGKLTRAKDGFRAQCNTCRHENYLQNREYNIKKQNLWYKNNREYALKSQKIYKTKNEDFYKEYNKEYYLKNSDKIKESAKRYLYNRIETDIGFKILQRCRKRLWEAVKNQRKAARTQELIGCTTEKLLKHLESKFTEGMTFENYGKWHVDHIIPCSKFDFSKEEEQKRCFNYTNLQPLWAHDNFAKHDKIITSE